MIIDKAINRVGKAGGSLYISLPKRFCKNLQWTYGDKVEISLTRDTLKVKKLGTSKFERRLKI